MDHSITPGHTKSNHTIIHSADEKSHPIQSHHDICMNIINRAKNLGSIFTFPSMVGNETAATCCHPSPQESLGSNMDQGCKWKTRRHHGPATHKAQTHQ